jgi:hypothetical protein
MIITDNIFYLDNGVERQINVFNESDPHYRCFESDGQKQIIFGRSSFVKTENGEVDFFSLSKEEKDKFCNNTNFIKTYKKYDIHR